MKGYKPRDSLSSGKSKITVEFINCEESINNNINKN